MSEEMLRKIQIYFRERKKQLEMDLVPRLGKIRKKEESKMTAGLNKQMGGRTNP